MGSFRVSLETGGKEFNVLYSQEKNIYSLQKNVNSHHCSSPSPCLMIISQ